MTRQNYTKLFNYYSRRIYAICQSIAWYWYSREAIPRFLTVDDLIQIAVTQVWHALAKYDCSRPLEKYIRKVASNAVIGAIRNLRREVPLEVVLNNYEPDTDGSLASRLREAIDSLPLGQRYIIDALYGANSLKMYEVAEELKLSRQSVSARKQKTIQHLQRKLRL